MNFSRRQETALKTRLVIKSRWTRL